jgi:MSHA biogenesis protein MshO
MRNRQRGFTLAEAIIVIVVTGILAAIVAVFIPMPMRGYVETAARADLTDAADTALRRMARDLRLALPNSIRIGTDGSGNPYIEFLLTASGGRYLAEEDNPTAGSILDFAVATNLSFDVVGPMPAVAAGNSVVVYNLGPNMAPADAYAGGNRAQVASVAAPAVTLVSNPFAVQTTKMRSPSRRFQVVTTPLTYGCVGGALTRYWGYAISPGQPTPPSGAGLQTALLATGATSCAFSYANLTNVRSGLVGLGLTLQNSTGETVSLFHQIHVDNTP